MVCCSVGHKYRDGALQGVPSISRAVINVKDKSDDRGEKGKKELLVEGYGLQKVMTTEGTSINVFFSNMVVEPRKS